MTEFNKLCKEFEEMDALSYTITLQEIASDVIPALSFLAGSRYEGEKIFANFLMGSVVSDGKLSEEEYEFMRPMMEDFFGEDIDYDAMKSFVKENKTLNKDIKENTDKMVDMFGQLSEELKDDIILVCLMVCAIDGKVSMKEKRWIKQLIKD